MESGAELYQIITETRSASMRTLALVDSTGHRTLAFSEEAAVWARDAAPETRSNCYWPSWAIVPFTEHNVDNILKQESGRQMEGGAERNHADGMKLGENMCHDPVRSTP